MAASVFSPLVPRWCGWCQQPLHGRSNKRFCSAACRGLAARHGVVEGGPIDWQARATQLEQTVQALQGQLAELAHTRQAVAPLERRYDEFMQLMNLLVVEVSSTGLLTDMLAFVEQLLAAYSQHPGLAKGEAGPQLRVKILQQVRGTLQRQLSYLTPPSPVAPSEQRGLATTPATRP